MTATATLSFAQRVFAQGSGGGTNPSTIINLGDLNPFGDCTTLECVLGPIFNILFYVSIPVCSIIVLWGGFQILTAGGDAEKVKTGGKTILYAAIGFVVVLLSNGVVSIITSVVSP
jgi:hypothetical protein